MINTPYFTSFKTRLWEIILVGDEAGITNLHMLTGKGRAFAVGTAWSRNDAFFAETKKQLREYFDGICRTFDIPLLPRGTDFQKKVWEALRSIPYGETRTYGDVARSMGNPGAARAVGMANSKNPIPIIIPCHRVIGSSGRLTGFAHGLNAKKALLDLETSSTPKIPPGSERPPCCQERKSHCSLPAKTELPLMTIET